MLFEGMEDTEAGTKFEQMILAELRKVDTLYVYPYSDTRSASREGSVRFINPQPADFGGVLPGGRAVMFEAKASRKADDLYDVARQAIRPIQAAAATRVVRQGGVYIFLYLDRAGHEVKAYEGGAVASFYRRKTNEDSSPLLSLPWSDRALFCNKLIEVLV